MKKKGVNAFFYSKFILRKREILQKLMLIKTWKGRLRAGTLLARRHRFLVDVRFDDGQEVVAHCVSPGRMEGLIRPGARVWLSRAPAGKRTLDWTWELIRLDRSLVCTNSWAANEIVNQLLVRRELPGFKRVHSLCREVQLGDSSRIDFLVQASGKSHFVEVKSVQQVSGAGVGYFPDSLASRSEAHLRALATAVAAGQRATILAVVQRTDAKCFRPSEVHDQSFCKELRIAKSLGVGVQAMVVEPTIHGFRYVGKIPTYLAPYDTDELSRWRDAMKPFSGWSRPKGNPKARWRQ